MQYLLSLILPFSKISPSTSYYNIIQTILSQTQKYEPNTPTTTKIPNPKLTPHLKIRRVITAAISLYDNTINQMNVRMSGSVLYYTEIGQILDFYR